MTTVSTPRKIATTATAGATLAKGTHTPVDATAGALTMTLPTTAAAGVEVSVEKVDASSNAVTMTGTIRGVAAQSIALTAQYDARTFLSEGAGSWRPTSDHRTATALAATIAAQVAPTTAQVAVLQAAGTIPLLAKFSSAIAEVALARVSATSYRIERNLGNQVWERWYFEVEVGAPGSSATRKMNGCNIETPLLSVNDTPAAGSVVYSGTGWANAFSNAAAYGGDYSRTSVVGDKVTWTTPADTTKVGIHSVQLATGGFAKVTIDGSTTRANLLPTAQQVVDSGLAPASVMLVASGGAFNPTDRVLEGYAPTTVWDVPVLFADDLPRAAHTVTVEQTAAKRPAATDSRVYVGGFLYARFDTTIATSGAVWTVLRPVTPAPAGIEYALNAKPTGTTTFTFVGTTHGYEDEVSVAFVLDGVTQTLTDGQRVIGKSLVVTKNTQLRHPQYGGGTTPWATVQTLYTMTRLGLQVQPKFTWSVDATFAASLIGMFNVDGNYYKKGRVDTDGTVYTLTNDDGGYVSQARGQAAWLWEPNDGRAAAILGVLDPDKAMNGWRDSDGINDPANGSRFLALQDRTLATGLGHKIYPSRIGIGNTVNVTAGTVWDTGAGFLYATQWFPVNPTSILSVA